MSCDICSSNNGKYRCPTCLISYCSLSCWKRHKEIPCHRAPNKTKENPVENKSLIQFPTNDTVSTEKLDSLGQSQKLRQILNNHHLQEILLSIDSSAQPGKDLHAAMQNDCFAEFAEECMKVVEPNCYDD